MKELNHISIILCRPAESGNVGAACRAMKAMGLGRLVIVDESALAEQEVARMAVHAYDVFERAIHCSTLEEALSPFALSAGTTRRRGRWRKEVSIPVQDFASRAWLGQVNTAVVFGNERTGLTDGELRLCDMAVHIPTSDDCPSLNLAQAVQIVSWELRRAWPGGRFGDVQAAGREAVEHAADEMANRLEAMDFFKPRGKQDIRDFLRDMVARAMPTVGELQKYVEIFRKAAGQYARKGSESISKPDQC